ncbi:MAG: sensor histidine kinase, partial [Candidatus Dormibacteraeota bacterium]|nr:sensor histidine kinase [Candidatus Dormibacteraeota bacterium]
PVRTDRLKAAESAPEGSLQRELDYYRGHLDALAAQNMALETRSAIVGFELKQRRQGLALLAELQATLGSATDEGTILAIVTKAIVARLQMDRAVILQESASPTSFEVVHAAGFPAGLDPTPGPVDLAILGPRLEPGRAVVLNASTSRDDALQRLSELVRAPYLVAAAMRPEGGPTVVLVAGRLKEVYALNPPLDESDADALLAVSGLVRLTIDLVRRVTQLRFSRERLVVAQDTERRRLVRDIHDGAQQQLLGIRMKLGITETLLRRDPAAAAEVVRDLKTEASEALESIRGLAHGIHPPLLTDQGILPALQAAVRTLGIPVLLAVEDAGRLAPEVEAATYFGCLEALQNVAKYARASRTTVTIRKTSRELKVCIEDDGEGFDPNHPVSGTGLSNIKDRVSALGGHVAVRSAPAEGTRISMSLPLPG